MKYNHIIKYHCLICFAVMLFLSGSDVAAGRSNGKREVTDMAGRKMIVPDTIRRVYTSRPGSMLLYAVDPGLAVCRTLMLNKLSKKYLDPAYVALPYTNDMVEEIVKMNPDIVINYFTINDKAKDEADRMAEKTGIPVFLVDMDMYCYPKTFDLLGTLLNREEQTNKMDAFVHRYLDTISIKAAKIPVSSKVKVYYAEGDDGLNTDPEGSFHSQVLKFTGAENIAKVNAMIGKGMSQVSMEQVIMWDPDLILCWTGSGTETYKNISSDEVWKTMRAIKNGKIYQVPFIPFGWIDRPPGTNRIIGTVWIAHLLYPDIFPYDMEKVTREYFRIFYHRELNDKELKEILDPIANGIELHGGKKMEPRSGRSMH